MMGLVASVAVGLFVLTNHGPSAQGRTNLNVVFLVVDAETDRPIGGALIRFWSFGSPFCQEDQRPSDVSLTTDANGRLARGWTNCLTSLSGLLNSTVKVSVPPVGYEASAAGYVTSQRGYLNSDENRLLLKESHPLSTLDVKIRLSKFPSLSTKSAERVLP
jgi:hypothetical protein